MLQMWSTWLPTTLFPGTEWKRSIITNKRSLFIAASLRWIKTRRAIQAPVQYTGILLCLATYKRYTYDEKSRKNCRKLDLQITRTLVDCQALPLIGQIIDWHDEEGEQLYYKLTSIFSMTIFSSALIVFKQQARWIFSQFSHEHSNN